MTGTTKTIRAPKVSTARQVEGTVVSAHEQKTVRVLVKTVRMHPKYQKQYVVSRKFAVHDEKNEAKAGDVVHFEECRPLSRMKRWRLVSIKNS
jgi:small subunit ribosomal protein S17